ncbi:MAG: M81 family metallopeptidase [Bacillota bacterium]
MNRIAIGQISHETNAFSPIPTDMARFEQRSLARGEEILAMFGKTKTPVGGFLRGCEQAGWTPVPTISAAAVPSGLVTAEAFDSLLGELVERIESAGPVAGVLLALHGAMVAENAADAEGAILKAVREVVGDDVPVVCTLDYHANVTDEMVRESTGLFGYNTYPHVDGYERGLEAAEFLNRLLRGEIEPITRVRRPEIAPAVVPARTGWGPMKELMERAFCWEERAAIVNASAYGGFVYSDIPEAGLAFLATTDGDPDLADEIVEDLARQSWEIREQFVADMFSPSEAVSRALEIDGAPVVLADVADNTGGGASGDGTAILKSLRDAGWPDAAVITIPDPEAVGCAFEAGIGGIFDCHVGGKMDDLHGSPVPVRGEVRVLSDGEFIHRGPMSTGLKSEMGRTAVVRVGETEIVINANRFQPVDPAAPRSVGIDPAYKKIVVLKSAVHYRASYEPLAADIIEVDGPGLSSPNLERFDFRNIRRPIFPLDEM